MSSSTIEEVIIRLENIVNEAVLNEDNLGVFAQLYLGVTRRVKEGIEKGEFEDGPRMERLDVLFANRYLDAYTGWKKGEEISKAWMAAFVAANKNDLLILQHLFMGMNAHINLDLGIAASETVLPQNITALQNDFDRINTILISMIEDMQKKINRASPLLFLLDWFGQKSDEHMMAFSLRKARSHAWAVALRLSGTTEEINRKKQIQELDRYVAILNKFITEPGVIGISLAKIIRSFEIKKPSEVINLMR